MSQERENGLIPDRGQMLLPVDTQLISPEAERILSMKTEVFDSYPHAVHLALEELDAKAKMDPRNPTVMVVAGDTGSGKGIGIGQAMAHTIAQALVHQDIPVLPVYSTTKDGSNAVRARGIETKTIQDVQKHGSQILNNANRAAKIVLPQEFPEYHVRFFRETVGIMEKGTLDSGRSIVDEEAKNDRALILFFVSDPETQERAYAQRWEIAYGGLSREQLQRRTRTEFDGDPKDVLQTAATPEVMEAGLLLMNQDMRRAFLRGKVFISDETAEEYAAWGDPRKLVDKAALIKTHRALEQENGSMKVEYGVVVDPNKLTHADRERTKQFFDTLSVVIANKHKKKLVVNPWRSVIQYEYIDNLAQTIVNKKSTKATIVIVPTKFLGKDVQGKDVTIHAYTHFGMEHKLDIDRFAPNTSVPKEDIAVDTEITPRASLQEEVEIT